MRTEFRWIIALACILLAAPASAQIGLVRNENFALDLTGYVRTLTGVHDAGFDLPDLTSTTGFHGAITRLKWTATIPGRPAVRNGRATGCRFAATRGARYR